MIDLDGRSYYVDDPTTNAYNILDYVNQFMTDHNVTDKNGDIVQFKISLASPIWLIILGIGYMASVVQKIMYATGQAFNIGSCSEAQVLNLAKIARLQRKNGSYTTISTTITAVDGICNITTDLVATVKYNDTDYAFSPMFNVAIPEGTSAEVILICTVTGPVFISSGAITEFDTEVTNLGEIVSQASQPGSNQESIASLRTRLFNNEAVSPMQGAIQGLNALDGVNKAVVFYNNSFTDSIVVANKTLPPKQAIVFVQGYSTKLAEEYFTHMTAQTFKDSTAMTMFHTLSNGQQLAFNYFPPQAVDLYIKVRVANVLTMEREAEIKNALAALSNSLTIGENYTQAYILDKINPVMNFPEIIGCSISVDGETWDNTTTFNESNVGLITVSRISMEVPVEEE